MQAPGGRARGQFPNTGNELRDVGWFLAPCSVLVGLCLLDLRGAFKALDPGRVRAALESFLGTQLSISSSSGQPSYLFMSWLFFSY